MLLPWSSGSAEPMVRETGLVSFVGECKYEKGRNHKRRMNGEGDGCGVAMNVLSSWYTVCHLPPH